MSRPAHNLAEAGRIDACFARLKAEKRGGLVVFISGGDPDAATSAALLRGLPGAGADIIELGMPFSDPMADGPAIQASSLRALKNGATLHSVLELVRGFRHDDARTPIVLMGYYNPIYSYGVAAFIEDARNAGVDGLIVVDLPPEEDDELCAPAMAAGLQFIRLATPTSDETRLPKLLAHTSGFIYYVSITGITGTASASQESVAQAVARLRRHTSLPVAVGFGIKTPAQAAEAARIGDAVVVGSALVNVIANALDNKGAARGDLVERALSFVRELAQAVRSTKKP